MLSSILRQVAESLLNSANTEGKGYTRMSSIEKAEQLRKLREEALLGGGKKRIEKQHAKGKLTARERVDLLLDEGSFEEFDMLKKHRCTNFGLEKQQFPGDGVVTGYGTIDGRLIYVFSQDFTVMGGSLSETFAEKILKVMEMAAMNGAPLIGLNDSGGARIQEGIESLAGYGDIFLKNVMFSGVIPQISAILGPCAGGAVYSPAITDFTVMVENTSYMFVTGPEVVKSVTGEDVTKEELGGAHIHGGRSGVAHLICKTEQEALQLIRKLVSYIPQNNMEDPISLPATDPVDRIENWLDDFIPKNPNKPYDMRKVIGGILDHGEFLEVQRMYAQNIIIGFGRMNGKSVGLIANQPAYLAGVLDNDASIKAARFIRFCDAFNIPLLTIADVGGYLPGSDQEWGGIIRHGAKLLWCYSEATVPKLLLITRKDYGGSYIAMSSKHLGADMAFAWPTAEIAVMGAEGASNIIHRKEIKDADDSDKKRMEKIEEYNDLFSNPYCAASRGYIDAVIVPSETRPRLIDALEVMCSKRETKPPKKHGNIPM